MKRSTILMLLTVIFIFFSSSVQAQAPEFDPAIISIAPTEATTLVAGNSRRNFSITIENKGRQTLHKNSITVQNRVLLPNTNELSPTNTECTPGGGFVIVNHPALQVDEIPAGGTGIYILSVRLPHGGNFILRCTLNFGGEDGPQTNNTMDQSITVVLPAPVICGCPQISDGVATINGLWFKSIDGNAPTVSINNTDVTILSSFTPTPYQVRVVLPQEILCSPQTARQIRITNSANQSVSRSCQMGASLNINSLSPAIPCPGNILTVNFAFNPTSCASTINEVRLNGVILNSTSTGPNSLTIQLPNSLRSGTNTLTINGGGLTVTQTFTVTAPVITAVSKTTSERTIITPAGIKTTLRLPALNIQISNLRSTCSRKVEIEYSKEIPDMSALGRKKTVWQNWKDCAEISLSRSTLIVNDPQGIKPPIVTGFRVKVTTDYGIETFVLPSEFY